MLDVHMSEDNFQTLRGEIDRQMELQTAIYDSLDNKIGVLLGFSLLAITAIALSGDLIREVRGDPSVFALFLLGVGFVIGSFIVGIFTYAAGKLTIGPCVGDLLDALRKDPDRNIIVSTYGNIASHMESNQQTIDMKGQGVMIIILLEALGIIQILISILIRVEA
jgi:hypothetical protein